jgi:enterochelin esterase-like enzyme
LEKQKKEFIMKKQTIFLIIIAATFLLPQSHFQSFISHVNSLSDPAARNGAVDSFMVFARSKGIPFIEGNEANFLYRGNVNSAQLAGDFNGWSPQVMTKLSTTNFYYTTKTFELNARLDYKIVTNGNNWILDPENPNTVSGGFGPNSELAMPEYVQPWEIKNNPAINKGRVVDRNIFSSNTQSNYQLKIYLPYGYDSTKAYPTVYFQDGFEYITLASGVIVLDNLIAANLIEPVIGVFVRPNNRNDEYAGSKRNQYRLFFVNELVPFIDSGFAADKSAEKRLVMGDSFGGNISALISYHHAEVFGNCGLHSAAFWPNGFETYNLIMNGETKDIKYVSVWGTYESLWQNMRNFRDTMRIKGYDFDALELPEGHSWGLWRATIDTIIMKTFPFIPSNVEEETGGIINAFKLEQNYPNPFNPSTKIGFSLPVEAMVYVRVYNVLGQEVVTLLNESKGLGSHTIQFDASAFSSGVYYYKIEAMGVNGFSYKDVKKMILVK